MSIATGTRIGLVLLALQSLLPGAWATASPRGFYDDFPGFGAHWISTDGPFNEHLIRDFGALNLALAVLALLAAVWMTRHLVLATAVAVLVYGIPHLAYHLSNGHSENTLDQVALYGGLAFGPLVAAALLVANRSPSGQPGVGPDAPPTA